MIRRLKISRTVLLLMTFAMTTAWTVPAIGGDTWLDEHGIRTDNVTLNGQHVTNMTYWQDPPFLSTKVPPNVLIVLDNSGSMNGAAYVSRFNPLQFISKHYYGYFDPTKMYRYQSQRWVPATEADLPATATQESPIASGNLLNWASMTRLEAAKKLLVGGKANPRSMTSGCCVKLVAETSSDNFIKTYANTGNALSSLSEALIPGYDNFIYPFVGNYSYRRSGDRLTISPVTSSDQMIVPASTVAGGGQSQWSVVGASTIFDAVNEYPSSQSHDGNTSYIENTANTTAIVLGYDPLPAEGTGTITSVTVNVVARRVYSSNSYRRMNYDIRGGIRIAGAANPYYSSEAGSGLVKNTAAYNTYTFDYPVNPKTNLPWTWEEISGGAGTISPDVLEGFGVQQLTWPSADLYMRVTKIYLRINATAPFGTYDIVIDTGTSDIHGIIDDLGNEARFGLAYYNQGASQVDTNVGTSNRNDGGTIETYIDFGSSTSMITSIGNLTPNRWTPLAETLYEMIRYFRQESPYYTGNSPADYQTGPNYDPYYFQYSKLAGSGLEDQYVPCAKSFILFLTDGESTKDRNIPASLPGIADLRDLDKDGNDEGPDAPTYPSQGSDFFDDVALWGRTVDHRSDLTGDQNIILYPVYMFGQGSQLLKDAAINGGFDDLNSDGKPGPDLKEYTRDSNGNGIIDSNDLPLTYFEGDDGYALQASIVDAISAILKRAASGTSVSVLGSSWRGEGSIFQAYFYPEKVEELRRIKWTGYFRSLFVDRWGLVHEDTNGDGKLVPSDDKVVSFVFIPGQDTKAELYWDVKDNDSGASKPDGKVDTVAPLDSVTMAEIKSIWDAGKSLALRDPADRKIYTSIDAANSPYPAAYVPPSLISFDTTNASALRPFIRGKTETDAENLIEFIRGEQLSGWRDRQLTVDGTLRTWKLGDIVFSDPVVVSAPKERFDKVYMDKSYEQFYTRWKNRRAVVYVGGNDGMLHALNAGYSIPGSDDTTVTASTTQITFCEKLDNDEAPTSCISDADKPLGKELWSFIPYDVLPHLAWLADPDYQHVYYVDLMPRFVDVRTFTPDATTHINGWGTVLILGLRMGGGEIDVEDDFGSGSATKRAFKSAYYALDVTDPDVPPTLLWRFTDDDLGFSTAIPSVVREGGDRDQVGSWYVVMGSGPSNYRAGRVVTRDVINTKFTMTGQVAGLSGMISARPMLFVNDFKTGRPLNSWSAHPSSGRKGVITLSLAAGTTDYNAFAASTMAADFPHDYNYDIIYGGTTYCAVRCNADGSPDLLNGGYWAGNLYRTKTFRSINPGQWQTSLAYSPDPGRPITTSPSAALDPNRHVWLFFGTGRFLHIDDRFDTSEQMLYGMKDQCFLESSLCSDPATTGTTDLLDTNNYEVLTNRALYPAIPGLTLGASQPDPLYTYDQLEDYMIQRGKGWFIRLGLRERCTVPGFALGGIAGFGTYTPTDDVCEFEGFSKQYFPSYVTGTAYAYPASSEVPTKTVDGETAFEKGVVSGSGLPSAPAVHVDSKGNTKLFIQQSTGAITVLPITPPINVRSGLGMETEYTESQ